MRRARSNTLRRRAFMLRESNREDCTIRRSAMPVAASAGACGSSIDCDRPQMTAFAGLRRCAAILMTSSPAIYSSSLRVSPSSRDQEGKPPQGQSERAVDLQAVRDRATIADVIGANADHPFAPPDLTIDQSAPREACHGRAAGGGSAISVGAFAADPQVQPIQQHSNSVFNIRSLYNQRDTG